MKRIALLFLSFLLTLCCAAAPALAEQTHIVASFYPIYILALPVVDGIEGISLDCMTAPETGCLHDYQLLVGDMMRLSDADALIICGAGMEAYLPDVQSQFPGLPVIDCSRGIDLILEEHHHDGSEEETEYNAHTWLDVQNAIQIVETITGEASALFPEHEAKLRENAAAYIARLQALDQELKEMLAPLQGKKIVTFHEAFPYFARAYGLEIAAVINEEHEDTLSPAQVSQLIETVLANDVPPLFTEPQYNSAAAYAVAAETGAGIYSLDPLVTGDGTATSYEEGMRLNGQALLEAFSRD